MGEAKDAETDRNLMAKRRFATLLAGHLGAGTHEKGAGPQPWTNVRFAHAVGASDRAVANWRNTEKPRLPQDISPILVTLFGTGPLHAAARAELQQAFTQAWGESRSRTEPATTCTTEPGGDPVPKPAGRPPEGDRSSSRPQSTASSEAQAEIDRTAAKIAARLKDSAPALEALSPRLGIAADAPARAAAVARALIAAGPRNALRTLRQAHNALSDRGAGPPALEALKQISQDIVFLIYEPDQIAAVRRLLSGGGGGLITVPAHNLTFAEIVMAKLDGRRLRLKGADPRDWRVGVNLIPMPPETGPEGFDGFRRDFERLVFERTLNAEELAWTDDTARRRRANRIIEGRFPDIEGSFYFAVLWRLHEREREAFEAFVADFMQNWPAIRCFKLDRDPELDDREVTLLRNVLDMLPEDPGPP